jgi:hypothetical protein
MNQKQRTSAAVVWIALVFLNTGVSATPVFVENAGFETFILDELHYTSHPSVAHTAPTPVYTVDPIPGWTVPTLQAIGTFNPTILQYPGEAQEGDNVAYIGTTGGAFSQTLSTTLAGNTRYTLSVYVGDRMDSDALGVPADISDYTVQLLAGGVMLAEDDNSLDPPEGAFMTSLVLFTCLSDNPLVGQPLGIRFASSSGYGTQVNFDDVRLDASPIPVPGAMLLGALGAGLVGWLRRHRRL